MARDAVAIETVLANEPRVKGFGTAIVPANGAVVHAGGDTRRLLLAFTGTASGAAMILAGTNPPAVRAGLGYLPVPVQEGNDTFVVIESARFAQANGDIYIDFTSGCAGTVAAYRLPKDV